MEGARALPTSVPQGGVQRGRTGGTDSPCSPVTRQFPQHGRLTMRGHGRHSLTPPASHQAAGTLPRGARPPGLPARGQNTHPYTCGTKVRILLPFSSLPLVDTVQLPEAARACRVAPCAIWTFASSQASGRVCGPSSHQPEKTLLEGMWIRPGPLLSSPLQGHLIWTLLITHVQTPSHKHLH